LNVKVMVADAVIQATGLVKTYGEVEAVRGIDLEVRAGEIFGFLGPNGAGKSTTISILCTLLKPTAGTARVAGIDVEHDPARVRQRTTSFSGSSPVSRRAGRSARSHRTSRSCAEAT